MRFHSLSTVILSLNSFGLKTTYNPEKINDIGGTERSDRLSEHIYVELDTRALYT